MRRKFSSISQSIGFPSICTLCNQFHQSGFSVCQFCRQIMVPLSLSCYYCAYPLSSPDHPACGHCIKKPPYFDRTIISYQFEEPLRSILHHFKYEAQLHYTSFLCDLIMESVKTLPDKPQCLLPVPMHPVRLKQKGFNQAAVLTKALSKQLQIPYDLFSCQKIINTLPQASLDGDLRKKNLRNAFTVTPLPYDHVAIIDDLLTTGCTANEIAYTLKCSGVSYVEVWCCARTVAKQK